MNEDGQPAKKGNGGTEEGWRYSCGGSIKLETRIFELCPRKYTNLSELARAMGISVSQIYRVRQGKRPISEKFITGTIKAFPGHNLDELFYVAREGSHND